MTAPLGMHQAGNQLTVINHTTGTVLLTDAYSEDQESVIGRPTGLETEAQEMLPGESFTIRLAPTLDYGDFHVTIKWIDEMEERGERTQRFT